MKVHEGELGHVERHIKALGGSYYAGLNAVWCQILTAPRSQPVLLVHFYLKLIHLLCSFLYPLGWLSLTLLCVYVVQTSPNSSSTSVQTDSEGKRSLDQGLNSEFRFKAEYLIFTAGPGYSHI